MQVSDVKEVGFIPASTIDGVIGEDITLLEGEWHAHLMRGLQMGPYFLWFLPIEQEQLSAFFGGEG